MDVPSDVLQQVDDELREGQASTIPIKGMKGTKGHDILFLHYMEQTQPNNGSLLFTRVCYRQFIVDFSLPFHLFLIMPLVRFSQSAVCQTLPSTGPVRFLVYLPSLSVSLIT